MKNHIITVTIKQEFDDGTIRTCEIVNNDGEYHDDPQGQIGSAVGNALRQILSSQNTGCNAEFWVEFLKQMGCLKDAGDWVFRLSEAIQRWLINGHMAISLKDYMNRVVRRETIQETADRLKIQPRRDEIPPSRFQEDAGVDVSLDYERDSATGDVRVVQK